MIRRVFDTLGLLSLVTALFFVFSPVPITSASDCGPPPLPPCAGQGQGENTASSASSSPAPSATVSASSTSCGPPPLPPCQGQGAGETSTTVQPTQSSRATSSSGTDDLIISNLSVTGSGGEVTLTFQTNQETNAIVTLTDEIQTSDLSRTVEKTTYTLDHEVLFRNLPLHGRFGVTITVTTKAGVSQTRDDTTLSLANGQATLSESPGRTSETPPSVGTAGEPGTTNSSANHGFLSQVLGTTLTSAGQRTIVLQDILVWILYLLSLVAVLLGVYFFAKRRRLWGVIYDARTKEPVEMAVVRLFDQEHHKLLETRVTPRSGRYSFLAEPGEYYLEVTKEGYHFPSRIVTSKTDNEYLNLYRGEIVKLGVGQSLVAPDIAIDSEAGEIKRASLFRRVLFPFLDTVRLPILLLAVLLAILFQLGGDSARQPFLSVTLLPLEIALALLLFIEFFFIRRGRK